MVFWVRDSIKTSTHWTVRRQTSRDMPVKPLVIESIGSKRVVNKTYYDSLEAASVNARWPSGWTADILDDIDSDKRSKVILQASRQMINAAAQTDSEKSDIEVVPNPGRRKANKSRGCIRCQRATKFSTKITSPIYRTRYWHITAGDCRIRPLFTDRLAILLCSSFPQAVISLAAGQNGPRD